MSQQEYNSTSLQTLLNGQLIESSDQRKREALERRLAVMRWVASILAVGTLAGGLLCVASFAIGSENNLITVSGIIICLMATLVYGLSYRLARPGTSPAQAGFACFLLLGTTLIATCVIQLQGGAVSGTLLAFVTVPVMAALLQVGQAGLKVSVGLSGGLLGLFFALEKVFKLYSPVLDTNKTPWIGLASWLIVFAVIGLCLLISNQRFKETITLSEEQAQKLTELLTALNSSTEFGISLSRELSGVTTELDETSREQADSTQEQVAALTEITASLEELNETAGQIAQSASAATISANQTVTIAGEVKEAGELAQAVASEGDEAVTQALSSVGRVRNRIELLGQRLLYLTEQTRKVGVIIDIIDEIADETHLLALNASIEAAGSIIPGADQSSSNMLRGDRFAVIAQEIKNLSDRSREATEEVRGTIQEMQGAVAAAVLVAEEGKKETAGAFSRSQIAGTVIEKLNAVIAASAGRAEQILTATHEVKLRCEEISMATSQQRSASQQILGTMRGVAQISQESAGAVSQLSHTVSRVNQQVAALNSVLNRSSQSARTAVAL